MPAPPPPPVVEPTLPLQVIGTWDDDKGASIFLAAPRGTLQARVGDVLLSEYRVVQVTRHEVLLRHIASNREFRLAVPVSSSTAALLRP